MKALAAIAFLLSLTGVAHATTACVKIRLFGSAGKVKEELKPDDNTPAGAYIRSQAAEMAEGLRLAGFQVVPCSIATLRLTFSYSASLEVKDAISLSIDALLGKRSGHCEVILLVNPSDEDHDRTSHQIDVCIGKTAKAVGVGR